MHSTADASAAARKDAMVSEAEAGEARIRNAQDLLAFMESSFEPGSPAKVLATVSPELRDLLENAPRTRWIPLELDAQFVAALIAYFGRERSVDLWAGYTARFIHTPLQRALIDGAMRLFGLSVGTFLRILPKVWGTAYRNAGELDISEKDKNWQRLVIRDMHPAMCEGPGYGILLRGMFRGMYSLAKIDKPDFDIDFDRKARTLRAEFRWE